MSPVSRVVRVLREALQLGDGVEAFDESTKLYGSMPELDVMAIITVVAGLEEEFNIDFDDDDISAEAFESVGSLTCLIQSKLGG